MGMGSHNAQPARFCIVSERERGVIDRRLCETLSKVGPAVEENGVKV